MFDLFNNCFFLVYDDGILIHLLYFWTLSIVLFLFRNMFFNKNRTMDNVQKHKNWFFVPLDFTLNIE
jgi:hypothetical protein